MYINDIFLIRFKLICFGDIDFKEEMPLPPLPPQSTDAAQSTFRFGTVSFTYQTVQH